MSEAQGLSDREVAEEILRNSSDPTARLLAGISIRTLDIAESLQYLTNAVALLSTQVDKGDVRFERLLDGLTRSYSNGSRPDMKAIREEIYSEGDPQ